MVSAENRPDEGGLFVKCTMASNRIGRINEEIQRELAELIRSLKDPRVQEIAMVSRGHCDVTNDLRYVKFM